MSNNALVLGLLNTAREIGDPVVAQRLRGLTIDWSRYGYHDRIIEGDTVDDILSAARRAGFRYSLVLSYGCVVHERWDPQDKSQSRDFWSLLREWVGRNAFHLAGVVEHRCDQAGGLRVAALLVDLDRQFGSSVARCGATHGDSLAQQVTPLPDELRCHLSDLLGTATAHRDELRFYLGDGIAQYDSSRPQTSLTADQRRFLSTVHAQAVNARRGVFLWNIESYEDIEVPRSDFAAPVSTLYSVAAGFKPNRILQTHGFDSSSRVVFFDYSPNALQVRKTLVEQWNGEAFPAFVRYLFQRFPHPETFYQLWDSRTPDQVTDEELETMWQRELDRWGGPQAFKEHWRRYQRLEHDYVYCDLLADSSALISRIVNESNVIVWWSNAFFTMYGNWLYSIEQRREIYEQWIAELAARNPQLHLFGSDFNNTNVNFVQAGEYHDEYCSVREDYLDPRKLHHTEIRM